MGRGTSCACKKQYRIIRDMLTKSDSCQLTSTSTSQQRSASPACRCIIAASCNTSSLLAAPMHALPTPRLRTLSSSWFAADIHPDLTLFRWHKQPGPVQQPLPPIAMLMLPARLSKLRLPARGLSGCSLKDAVVLSRPAGIPDPARARASLPAAAGGPSPR